MKKYCAYMILVTALLLGNAGIVAAQSRNTLRITEDDHLLLQIDLRSNEKTLDSIFNIAGVSAKAGTIKKGDFDALLQDHWKLVERNDNIVQFDRSLNELNDNPPDNPYTISLEIPQLSGKPGYPADVKYGVNKFSKITVYGLPSGLTRFMLPGYTNKKRVFLAGSFNGWSTLKTPMQKTDGGWIVDMKLEPGIHQYKYIIGGGWSTDPNNLQIADDGAGNTNSVYFKYNHTFKLKGHVDASRVTVTGDFNDWDLNELPMERTATGWQKDIYLGNGKRAYRFIVDGTPIIDPANKVSEKDVDENINSIITLGKKANFKLSGYANAKKVFVAGDFNNWKPHEFSLKRTADGWVLPLILPPGNYGYKFIVDGKWIRDPKNPHTMFRDGEENSLLAVQPNYTFRIKGYADAKSIKLSGTFNNWDKHGYTMVHKGDEWVISLNLKPGKYLYKFIVDGQWIRDPGNQYWEERDSNSVLWIEY